jgi:hypothetical protein
MTGPGRAEGHDQVTGVDDMEDLIVDVDGQSHWVGYGEPAAVGG